MTGKLEKGAKVADVGCGHGHSTVLMAKAFPSSRFWGFDVHEDSIAEARKLAREASVDNRVSFEVEKADGYTPDPHTRGMHNTPKLVVSAMIL